VHLLSQLLSEVTVTSCSFCVKCGVYLHNCCTPHSTWRRSDSVIANFLLILTVKEFRKAINIWWSWGI